MDGILGIVFILIGIPLCVFLAGLLCWFVVGLGHDFSDLLDFIFDRIGAGVDFLMRRLPGHSRRLRKSYAEDEAWRESHMSHFLHYHVPKGDFSLFCDRPWFDPNRQATRSLPPTMRNKSQWKWIRSDI